MEERISLMMCLQSSRLMSGPAADWQMDYADWSSHGLTEWGEEEEEEEEDWKVRDHGWGKSA